MLNVVRAQARPGDTAVLTAGRKDTTDRVVLLVYTAAIFLNAGLLFAVQPMFSKMVLPLFGGSAAVWTTCMLFFQATLLAGYLYAHAVSRLELRAQVAVHLLMLLLALFMLPLTVSTASVFAAHQHPVLALLLLLTLSLGAPFFVLSGGSPLLQHWFSHTHHRDAVNPYFLYGASNLGCLVALLSYPLIWEPRLRLPEQSMIWTYGYVCLIVLMTAAVVLVLASSRDAAALPGSATRRRTASAEPRWRVRIKWVALSFVPSSLLLGLTTFLTTDIAPIPMLWVIPLALYLFTFVVAFARRRLIGQRVLLRVQPFLLLPVIVSMALGGTAWPFVFLPLHVLAFFVAALICHMELARVRPPIPSLTEFYFWVSLGGVLGGFFNVAIAPAAFSAVTEYPLALVVAALLRPNEGPTHSLRRGSIDVLAAAVFGLVVYAALMLYVEGHSAALVATGSVAAVVLLSFSRRPVRFTAGMGALLIAGALATPTDVLLARRSFYGVHRVERDPAGYHVLSHGSTIHGAQSLDPRNRLEPLTYYHRSGPVGDIFSSLPAAGRPRKIAVIGLGTGSMACYGASGDQWTYYEIDPAVEQIARDARYFTFLRNCPPKVKVVLGDARLTLVAAPANGYDLIVLDAFTSDAIPTHLLTKQAFSLYLDKLADGGVVAFHISNRYLDLEPVVARLALHAGLSGAYRYHTPTPEQQRRQVSPSVWVVAVRDRKNLKGAPWSGWKPLATKSAVGLWSDDFSDVLSVLKWRD